MSTPSPELLEATRRRRERALSALGDDAALLLAATPELRVGREIELPYVVDPELYYLTAYTEPEAVALLLPAGAPRRFVLFVRPRNPDAELWTGPRGGPDAAQETFGADAAYPIDELRKRLPDLIGDVDTLYARLPLPRNDVDATVRDTLAAALRGRPRRGAGARAVVDPGVILDPMRVVKDDYELTRLREAAAITAAGFDAAADAIADGAGEWQVQAALEAEFRRLGAQGPAFSSILASGPNATVLHYVANDRRMRAGELLLVDAGARVDHYCGDRTRTLPVSGRFTPQQQALHDVVEAAHDAAFAVLRPGAREADLHDAVVRELAAGLVRLSVLDGDPAEIAADPPRYKPFFPHRTSHWIGLEVHDAGDYKVAAASRTLEPGMVLTIEPGLYFGAATADLNVPDALRGAGVRFENTVLVTETGAELL